MVRYMEYQRAQEHAQRVDIRREIETYNRDDVLATRALEVWVRELIVPENSRHGGVAI